MRRARPAVLLAALVLGVLAQAAPAAPPPGCVQASSYRVSDASVQPSTVVVCTGSTGQFSAEPTVGVTADGTVVQYPAYEQHPGTSYTRAAMAVSHDGGQTFSLAELTAGGVAPTHAVDLDPFLYVDPRTSRVFVESNVSGACDVLSTSDDAGRTWTTTTLDGCVTSDHENLFAGPAPRGGAAPSGYPDVVYRCAYMFGMFGTLHTADGCEKSLDGGLTWALTGTPAFVYDPSAAPGGLGPTSTPYHCMDQLGHGTVGPDGTVYLPAGMCGRPEVAVSHDEGRTWTRSVVSATTRLHALPNGVTVNDTAVAAGADGTAYALWVAADGLPRLAVSRDEGRTWGGPVLVAPPGTVGAALPEVAAGPDGRLALAFMGSRDSTTWYGYLLVSQDPAVSGPRFTGGPVASGPFVRGSCGPDTCQEEKDFVDVRFGPDGTAYGAYVDACSAACARGGTDDTDTGVVARLRVG